MSSGKGEDLHSNQNPSLSKPFCPLERLSAPFGFSTGSLPGNRIDSGVVLVRFGWLVLHLPAPGFPDLHNMS